MKILVVSGHPNLASSTVNSLIINELKSIFTDINVRDLGALYPNKTVDVATEQVAMAAADIMVWQFPLYWYTVPAVMKGYIDNTLTYGFAYGSTGNKLHGKKFIISLTAGGNEADYSPDGHEGMPLDDFLHQFVSTAHLCGMDYQNPVYSYGMHYINGIGSAAELKAVQNKAYEHASRLIAQIQAL